MASRTSKFAWTTLWCAAIGILAATASAEPSGSAAEAGGPASQLSRAKQLFEAGSLVKALHELEALEAAPRAAREPTPFKRLRAEASELHSDLLLRVPLIKVHAYDLSKLGHVELELDGAEVGITVDPGHHRIIATRDGRHAEVRVEVVEGEHRDVFVKLPTRPRPTGVAANASEGESRTHDELNRSPPQIPRGIWLLTGTAVAGLTTAAATGVLAQHQSDQLEQGCAPYCKQSSLQQVARLKQTAYVSLGVGAAAGIAALVWYLVLPSQRSHDRARTAPLQLAVIGPSSLATWNTTF